jgi:hypothetical protein
MRKIILLIVSLIVGVKAYTLHIKQGWQLRGTEHDINVSIFNNSKIVSVWAYDDENKKWKAFLPNKNINLNKYGIEALNKIDKFKGYWIKASKNFDIDINGGIRYPIVEKLGNLWGFEWYEVKAIYPGDYRYKGNEVILDLDNKDLILKAYKKDNKDSRAQAFANLPSVKRFSAEVNLVKDNIYSHFQAIAVANNIITSEILDGLDTNKNLSFWAGLNINKHSIIYWWDICENNGKYLDTTVAYKTYSEDLTNLTDKSDVKIEINTDGQEITYKVYNLSNGKVLFNKFLDINTTKMTNFKGFDKVIFRSRIKDDKANKMGEESIKESENIINNFNIN